jgi:hypothetical protein
MTAMAVEDKEPVVSPLAGFLLCVAIKHLFEPRYTNVIVAPA